MVKPSRPLMVRHALNRKSDSERAVAPIEQRASGDAELDQAETISRDYPAHGQIG